MRSAIIRRNLITYEFTDEEKALARRLAIGRMKGKIKGTSHVTPDGSDPEQKDYEGVLGEIAAAFRYGGYVSEEFTGARGDKKADLLDSDGYWLEVKADTWQGDDLQLKLLPHLLNQPDFDTMHFVLVRLRPKENPTLAEIYPAIHALRVRRFGFWKNWGYGKMWNVPAKKILNQNEP
jgi:hypothetical protein